VQLQPEQTRKVGQQHVELNDIAIGQPHLADDANRWTAKRLG